MAHICRIICMYKIVRPITNLLTQHGPGDFMEDWVRNFGVQIVSEALTRPTLTKWDFAKSHPFPQDRRQKHFSEHNSAPNYLT